MYSLVDLQFSPQGKSKVCRRSGLNPVPLCQLTRDNDLTDVRSKTDVSKRVVFLTPRESGLKEGEEQGK